MNRADYKVKCPFYSEWQDNPQAISCEGVSKGNKIKLTFYGKKEGYIKNYCAGKYTNCIICKALMSKYEKG